MSMHYKRITAVAIMAVFVLGLTSCKKEKIDVPTVKVFEGVITINYTKASVSAEVTDQGGAEVKSRGFAYGESGGTMDTIFCGSGTGVYSAELTNLEPNTTYVYEAFAKNTGGFGTSGKVTFTTKDNEKPTVKTNEVKEEDVTTTTASVSGIVMDDGGTQIIERGVCWSTSHTPTVSDSFVSKEGDLGEYTCDLTNLSPNTKYYACAYAKNSKGLAYGNEVSFHTKPLQTFMIEVSANPSNGGTVTGGGTFDEGQSCTAKATENTGYNFVNWTENSMQVSTDREYTFDVTANRNLEANFTAQPCTITATLEPEEGGTVSGSGGYNYGDHCVLTATANPGYDFTKWTENGTQISTNATYSFDVTGNRDLKAHFTLITYTISATAEPSEGGRVSVSGNGEFHYNDECTLTATPNPDYAFVNFTKNGTVISSQNPCRINVTESAEYVAHFQSTLLPLTVTATANPSTISLGSSSTLTANTTGGNGNYTYNWTPATGLNNSQIQSPTATPTTTTIYTVTISSIGQTATANVTVYVVRPPTNLSRTVSGNNVNLTWTAPNSVSFYKVYRNNTLIKTGHTATTYTDSNLSAGTYSYYVTAMYNDVESPPSNTIQAIINLQTPTGAVNGLFSVSSTKQVWFSQGNLQYKASNSTWRFATNQYDCIGSANSNISSSYSGWIDLFGWGTSGWNCGNTYYRPWDSNNSNGSLYGPQGNYNLTGSYANSDWGYYNAISNGGNQNHQWRTLTQSEWNYVFNTRSTTSGIRYAKAQVSNVNGVILLPDNWSNSYYTLYSTNNGGANFSSNVISSTIWASSLEAHGAVFLPAAGFRNGTSVLNVGSNGFYWSTSYSYGYSAWGVDFYNDGLSTDNWLNRYGGQSVRLVCPVE